jgi:hypothetical protein
MFGWIPLGGAAWLLIGELHAIAEHHDVVPAENPNRFLHSSRGLVD